jgi:hypothetical protein
MDQLIKTFECFSRNIGVHRKDSNASVDPLGANARAQQKARRLGCVAIVMDLEDALAPDAKGQAA